MHGYKNNPEANADAFANGWFRTGDQGMLDRTGYLTLTGRIKELINRGGEKISPLEVDAILLQHPSVAEAVCFGVPDEKYGECVQAAVVLDGAVRLGRHRRPLPGTACRLQGARPHICGRKPPAYSHRKDPAPPRCRSVRGVTRQGLT